MTSHFVCTLDSLSRGEYGRRDKWHMFDTFLIAFEGSKNSKLEFEAARCVE